MEVDEREATTCRHVMMATRRDDEGGGRTKTESTKRMTRTTAGSSRKRAATSSLRAAKRLEKTRGVEEPESARGEVSVFGSLRPLRYNNQISRERGRQQR